MEVAALGRPFCLGMLYDCRRDLLVPGMTLWDHDDLKNHIREKQQSYSDFEIVASETIEDKSSALNIEASLKASVLSGLVEVDGSAKYLNDKKASRNLARVTLQYKATTKFQELSMNHLGQDNMKHRYVFDKGIATHVVTAILYGAQAFFVFDREVSENEDHQDIRGELKAMIKRIPGLANEGEGNLKMENKEMANVEKFSCRFYGDFALPKPPSSFQDAIQVYQSLPKLLGLSGENAVPVKVWLLPLTILDCAAAQLVCQIRIRLVQEAQRVLEDISELDIRCSDAMRTTTAQQFPQIRKKIEHFKEKCSEFKAEFQQNLANKLPLIRGGVGEESLLTEILMKRQSSPFNSKNLNEWMDCKEREICVLKSFTNLMKNTKIVASHNGLHEETLSAEHAVCFAFTSLGNAEPYLLALSNYVKVTTKPDDPQDPQAYDVEKEQWYLSREGSESMRKKAKLFSDFAESNKENKNIKFLSMGLTNETLKGSSIYLYKDGSCVNDNFQPPSKPETVTVNNIDHNTVTLHISPPQYGVEGVTSYSVEYCVRGEDRWEQKTVLKAEEVKVSNLSPNTEYVFRCRAVTSVGVGPVNEANETIKTLPCSPPGKPQVEPNSSEISVSWKRAAAVGQGVQVLSYIIEYAQTDDGVNGEDLQWSQTMSRAERAIISGLKSETQYVVRVICDCGVSGRSKESTAVNVCTTKLSPLTELLKCTSERIHSESLPIYKLPLTEVKMNIEGCQRFNFGKESLRKDLTIILFGIPGSEKSTLINGMINYIVGVEWKDNFRFKLIDDAQLSCQVKSHAAGVVVYNINHQDGFKIDYSLTIVDVADDEHSKDQQKCLHNLFSANLGVKEINAVCFVALASLTQLTPTQKDVFHVFPSFYKRSVEENVRVLVTSASGQRPPVLEAISAAGVPCPKAEDGLPLHFKFNNSALFANNKLSAAAGASVDDADENYNQMFWDVGTKSMKMFFDALNEMETKSLVLSRVENMDPVYLAYELRRIGHSLDHKIF